MSASPLVSLRFGGEDHRAFLHRMFTHDLQQLPAGNFRFAALCNNKGRVIANGLFLEESQGLCMVLPACQVETVLETLKRYRLRDRVEMEPDPNHWVLHWQGDSGLAGEGVLKDLRLQPGEGEWVDAACQAGLALVVGEERERHVPQTLNMDLAEGIHFSKGCYPGQEVVARLHYLGKPKNRCLHFTADGPVTPGTPLFRSGQPTETVGTCILAGKQGHLLCTVKTALLQNGLADGLVAGEPGTALRPGGLPYAL